MARTRPTKKFGRYSFVTLVAGAFLNTCVVKIYRHLSGEVQKGQGEESCVHRHLHVGDQMEDGSTCANLDASVSLSTASLSKVVNNVLLQVSSRQSTVGSDAVDAAPPNRSESAENSTPSGYSRLAMLSTVYQQPPTGNVAITVQPLACNTAIYAPDGVCPITCPYFAEEGGRARACYFQCVKKSECGSLDPTKDIADSDLGICRKCRVFGCSKCAKGRGDECEACEPGFVTNPDGTCTSEYWKIWSVIFALAGIIGVVLFSWLIRLWLLPVTNAAGLKEGLAYRSSLKLRIPRSLVPSVAAMNGVEMDNTTRPLWPISTNLHAIQVAGPGLTLHMNFQLALIVWGCGVVVTWVIFTFYTNPEMLVLGLYPSDTPQELCSVTLRGKELQSRLIPTKLVFLILMYVFTFAFNFAYALYQRRKFLVIDDETTMSDFVAICTGLPSLPGTEKVEDIVKESIEAATKEKVVGVSVCWACKEFDEEVQEATDREVEMLEGAPTLQDQATLDQNNRGMTKVFGKLDAVFGFTGELPDHVSKAEERKSVEELLPNISSTDSAFIVFETESSRDKAVAAVHSFRGISFKEHVLHLKRETCEPDTVNWNNFNVSQAEFFRKLSIGTLSVLIGLVLWCFCFYYPFAYYQASYAKQGEEPGFVAAFIFSMLVVAGNQIMYFICAVIADSVGFRFNDNQEAIYIAMYTAACTLNLVVDMAMEFYLAYEAAIAAGAYTADGKLLEDLTGFQEIFETYVMQKAVGTRLFEYCFPATFLIPFIMEPIFAIFLPYEICKLLLRTHPEVKGREAEKSLDFFAPMDMGRYGDLLLNIMLSVLIVFFPPGTFLKMMLALVVSHIFVYLYDQYRILRSVPAFDYSSDCIERLVQILMGVPLSFLAAGIVFKGNAFLDLQNNELFAAMAGAAIFTFVLHTLLMKFLVPRFDSTKHHVSESTFADFAESQSSTWFSENPVHCLRSKYFYKHNPPCMFNTRGKDYLIKKNEKACVYFSGGSKVGAEEYQESDDTS
jgi:hypothetical protein